MLLLQWEQKEFCSLTLISRKVLYTGRLLPSNRIIQDITRMTENIILVIEAGGAIVPGVCDRNGHRRKKRETETCKFDSYLESMGTQSEQVNRRKYVTSL